MDAVAMPKLSESLVYASAEYALEEHVRVHAYGV